MGITVCPNWIFADPSQMERGEKTIDELRQKGRYYRHPDSAQISYPLVVEKPLGRIGRAVNIAVVGGGIAGIAAIYELSRLADARENICVTLFESDHEHFTYSTRTLEVETYKQRAGRIFAGACGDANSDSKHTVYEIGAMRFPEIAGLTWHYASQVYDVKTECAVFPNPGKVPTEFVQGERVDRYTDTDWLEEDSPTREIADKVAKGLFGNEDGPDVSLFRIGGKDPAKVSKMLKSENTHEEDLEKLSQEWKAFANTYDSLTLESAVRQVIAASEDDEAKIDYYVKLFGRFGFGTGGFKPIFNTSLTEMTRLTLWQYSNEYSLPVEENVHFVRDLYEKAISNGFKEQITVKRARVCDVCHLEDEAVGAGKSAAVFYYYIDQRGKDAPDPTSGKKENPAPTVQKYECDYVILAVTPKQASSMVSRVGFHNSAREVILGDYPHQCEESVKARPALVLSAEPEAEAENSKVFTSLNQVHMVASSKVFATIKKTIYDDNAPSFNNIDKIRALITDCGLATTYIIPSPFQPNDYYTCMLSYTWEDDTKALQNELLQYPKNVGSDNPKNRWMIEKIINHTIRDVVDPETRKYTRWWFGELLSKADRDGELTDFLSYDWTTHHSSGAFKLDVTGDHRNSNLLFRYHTHARQARDLDNRFFLANCSYSHLGGWIEGAFMSAVNAVCGLILAANQGDLNALSPEAKLVITSLDPVA